VTRAVYRTNRVGLNPAVKPFPDLPVSVAARPLEAQDGGVDVRAAQLRSKIVSNVGSPIREVPVMGGKRP
jgi:hypothetical protein